ncbi:MAG: hypothetical protein JWR51_4678 [Devosia sp.]|uniref:hypothetical protein n=1 Tax=Devosia sp. TaxID=1871048 RepID=UPI00262EFDC3|nr:hypothetical protein [Devosia sp.]MDB5531575.1 hypothetical protein [Devosia sp.]
MSNPELKAKSLAFILLDDKEKASFDALTFAQKGYFLHWFRSNRDKAAPTWPAMIRRAKEQRP